jgi:hypothetical protein
VVILLLVLLGAGVALIGMRQWWESSARVRCMEHLEKMMVAVAAHQDKKSHLPASRLAKGYATWAVQLAPYMASTNIEALRQWDLTRTYYAQPESVRQAQIAIFYCPARRYPPQLSSEGDVQGDTLFPGALGDYACSSGDGSVPWDGIKANGAIIPAEVVKQEGDQLLDYHLLTDLNKLPRGQSPTILIGEKHVPLGQFGQVAAGDGSLYNGDHLASFARVGGPGFGLSQSVTDPFNNNFGSAHPGICQFLMADGSVKSFDVSLSPIVLGKLTNRLE